MFRRIYIKQTVIFEMAIHLIVATKISWELEEESLKLAGLALREAWIPRENGFTPREIYLFQLNEP